MIRRPEDQISDQTSEPVAARLAELSSLTALFHPTSPRPLSTEVIEKKEGKSYEKVKSVKAKELCAKFAEECETKGDKFQSEGESQSSRQRIAGIR